MFIYLKQMECSEQLEKVLEDDDEDGGWVDTHHYDAASSGLEDKVSEMTLDSSSSKVRLFVIIGCWNWAWRDLELQQDAKATVTGDDDDEDDDEEAADMEEFEESGLLDEQDQASSYMNNIVYLLLSSCRIQ